jgi:hypothetical protein
LEKENITAEKLQVKEELECANSREKELKVENKELQAENAEIKAENAELEAEKKIQQFSSGNLVEWYIIWQVRWRWQEKEADNSNTGNRGQPVPASGRRSDIVGRAKKLGSVYCT